MSDNKIVDSWPCKGLVNTWDKGTAYLFADGRMCWRQVTSKYPAKPEFWPNSANTKHYLAQRPPRDAAAQGVAIHKAAEKALTRQPQTHCAWVSVAPVGNVIGFDPDSPQAHFVETESAFYYEQQRALVLAERQRIVRVTNNWPFCSFANKNVELHYGRARQQHYFRCNHCSGAKVEK